MKILIGSTWKAICGIATYNNYFTGQLRGYTAGHGNGPNPVYEPDVFILAEDRKATGPDDSQVSDVPYEECWNRYTGFEATTGFRSTLDVIKDKKPDVLHWSHEFGLFCLSPQVTVQYIDLLEKINKLGIRQTVTYHSVPQYPTPFFKGFYNESSTFLEKIIVHTKEQLNSLINEYKVPQSKLVHINHGVLLCPLYDKGKAKSFLGIPENKKVIMSMGFFGGLKGVAELIDIHSEINKQRQDTLFYFVGGLHYASAEYGKDYMKQCFRQILKHELHNKFVITGYVKEDLLPWYYAASDLAVLNYKPSGYLSASGCSAKLAASKRLIITTDSTHRNDELENGVECIKINYADMGGLKDAIVNQLDNPDEKIINNAYGYAQQNQWRNAAGKHLELWR